MTNPVKSLDAYLKERRRIMKEEGGFTGRPKFVYEQSRRGSVLEAIANVLIGIGVAYITQVFVFPLFGWNPPTSTHLAITGIFTVVSLIRSYLIRRLFNRIREGWFA